MEVIQGVQVRDWRVPLPITPQPPCITYKLHHCAPTRTAPTPPPTPPAPPLPRRRAASSITPPAASHERGDLLGRALQQDDLLLDALALPRHLRMRARTRVLHTCPPACPAAYTRPRVAHAYYIPYSLLIINNSKSPRYAACTYLLALVDQPPQLRLLKVGHLLLEVRQQGLLGRQDLRGWVDGLMDV